MATFNNPYIDAIVPAPGIRNTAAFWGDDKQRLGIMHSLFAFTEAGGRTNALSGTSNPLGRHVIFQADILSGVNAGRYMELFTIAGSDLAAATLHSSGRLLTADNNHDPADMCSMGGYVFSADGKATNTAPGCPPIHLAAFLQDDGGTFYDYTNAANDASLLAFQGLVYNPSQGGWVPAGPYMYQYSVEANSYPLPVIPAVNDAIYIARWQTFPVVFFNVGTARNGTLTVTWEYWNGSAWTALAGVTDGTTGFSVSGWNSLRYTMPADWATTTVGGYATLYFIRGRVSAVTTTPTTQAIVGQAFASILRAAINEDNSIATFVDETSDAQDDIAVTTGDVNLLPATQALNDAFYIGADQTFRSASINIVTAAGGTFTLTWEFWNGSAWTALTGVTDNTRGFTVTGERNVMFTLPTTWQTQTVNSQGPFYYIRGRISAFTGSGTQPVASAVKPFTATGSKRYSCSAHHIGEDPGTVAPVIVGWGIDLLDGGVDPLQYSLVTGGGSSSADMLAVTFYDSIRDIESRPVFYGAGPATSPWTKAIVLNQASLIVTARDHNHAQVDSIRVYFIKRAVLAVAGTTASAPHTIYFPVTVKKGETVTLATTGTGVIWKQFASSQNLLATGSDLEAEVISAFADFGCGPMGVQDFQANKIAAPLSCCVKGTRAWAAGGYGRDMTVSGARQGFQNRVWYSAHNKPHNFSQRNFIDIAATDGDRIVCIRALFDTVYVFKQRHIYKIVGEPDAGLQVLPVSYERGCIAKRTAITSGDKLYFLDRAGLLTIDAAGGLPGAPVSEKIRKFILDATDGQIQNACAAWWPDKKLYLLALPGLQAQSSGGAGPGQTINDGVLAYHEPTGQWMGPWLGIYAASMATVWKSSQSFDVWIGDYWGRLHQFTGDNKDGHDLAGKTYNGTVSSATTSTLTDSTASFPLDSAATGLFVLVTTTAGGRQIRMLSEASATVLTIYGTWTSTPNSGETYYIGHIYSHAETGDLVFEEYGAEHQVESVAVRLAKQLNSGNQIEVAVDPTEVEKTGTGFTFSSETVSTDVVPRPLEMPTGSGRTARIRVAIRSGAERPKIIGMDLNVLDMGMVSYA